MLSNISECRRSEQGIAYRMKQNVCIRVSQKPKFKRDFDTADYAGSALGKSVNIISVTYSQNEFSLKCIKVSVL